MEAPTINKQISLFLSGRDISDSSKGVYSNVLHGFYKFLINSNRSPGRIKTADLLYFKSQMQAKGKAATTLNLYLSVLRTFFSWQKGKGYAKLNLADGVKLVPLQKRYRRGILTRSQVKQLIDSIPNDIADGLRDRLMIRLAWELGLRCVELSRLKVENIEGSAVWITGKGSYDQVQMILSRGCLADILEFTEIMQIEKGHIFRAMTSNPRQIGKPLTRQGISKVIARRIKKSGLNIPGITAHSLRHSCAVELLKQGQSIVTVSAYLRHTSIKTTELYIHHAKLRALQESKLSDLLSVNEQ
jgi:site-specific recombinase XerD